jgi:acyl dehydratase
MSNPFGASSLQLYLDDLGVGQRFESGSYTLNEAQVRLFAEKCDPQPFHLSAETAVGSFFDGLAASGFHTAAITMRLIVSSLPIAGGVIGAGCEIKWPRPTRPGDTLKVEIQIVEIRPSRSHSLRVSPRSR